MEALKKLGDSGSIVEIYEKVIELEDFDEKTLAEPHNSEKSSRTKIEYNLAWARTYLKNAGYLENSSRGVWSLTEKAAEGKIDSQEIVKNMRSLSRRKAAATKSPDGPAGYVDSSPEEIPTWREEFHRILTEEMRPDAFERLIQRVLRESGFVQVEITGKTGDGGIDGKGIARINDWLSFHIVFQCKKYRGSVGASEIRNFRGAIVGRADRGMFITTGSFTRAAIEEANRDGAPPIDLVDGEKLADKFKELSLGIKTEMVEDVTLEEKWFLNL